jgi:(p)ppGpp synthase/HD superfamily hydrolase
MKYTPQIERAIQTATRAHRNQSRKGDPNLSYISHPFSVFIILSEYTTDEDVLIAGLLHDVLEDADPSEYSVAGLTNEFGRKIVSIVREVSEKKDGDLKESDAKNNWEERKIAYLKHLKTSSSEALLVSTADKLHNIENTLLDYKKLGSSIWDKFNAPKEKQIWFYKKFNKIIIEKLDNEIVQKLNAVIIELENTI